MASTQSAPTQTASHQNNTVGVAVMGVISVALVLLAARYGWLGPDVNRGADFCEASGTGWLLQPVSTLSNLGFVVAGVLIARQATHPLMVMYAVIVTLLGPGSMAMHATESAVGGHLDLLSMYLVASFTATMALSRGRSWSTKQSVMVYLGLLLACELIGALPVTLPVVMHPGNLVFGILLTLTLVLEARAREVDLRWAGAAGATLVVAFGIWTTGRDGNTLCREDALIQQHGIWHLLCAVAAYLMFLAYRGSSGDRPSTPVTDRGSHPTTA